MFCIIVICRAGTQRMAVFWAHFERFCAQLFAKISPLNSFRMWKIYSLTDYSVYPMQDLPKQSKAGPKASESPACVPLLLITASHRLHKVCLRCLSLTSCILLFQIAEIYIKCPLFLPCQQAAPETFTSQNTPGQKEALVSTRLSPKFQYQI